MHLMDDREDLSAALDKVRTLEKEYSVLLAHLAVNIGAQRMVQIPHRDFSTAFKMATCFHFFTDTNASRHAAPLRAEFLF